MIDLQAFVDAFSIVFPLVCRIAPIAVSFLVLSFMIRLVRCLVVDAPASLSLPEPKPDPERELQREIEAQISDGSFDLENSTERWAKFYEEQMAK